MYDDSDLNKLSNLVFSSEKLQKTLNKIVWPKVYDLMINADNTAHKMGAKLFIVDAALLFEAGLSEFFHSILLITANKNIRYNRILLRGNIYEEQIHQRMALQMPEREKKKLTSATIENNEDINELYMKLNVFYNKLNVE